MRKFVGITIGPIGDTIGDASSPGALWFASSLFSDITRRICEEVMQEFTEPTIYSPYYTKEIKTDDGIGKFHDRILFSVSDFSHEKMEGILDKVKVETIQVFPKDAMFCCKDAEAFFREYLQIHYVVKTEEELEKDNCILDLSPCLDAMELMKTFPKDDSNNPIRKLFLGEDENGNKYIKDSVLYQRVLAQSNQLKKDGKIRNIEEIANCNGTILENYKRKDYYAVVLADGDGMGKFLEKLSNERITDFSKCCLDYAQKAAEKIGSYGGMTIYVGGDDLLFLAPVMTREENIFGLCHSIRNLFRENLSASGKFDDIEQLPTISFGISIQYKKFPLYEALKTSTRLLALAKADGDLINTKSQKNNMMVEVQKHSGQSLSLMISNEAYETLKTMLSMGNDFTDEQRTLHSVLYTLDNFSAAFSVLNQQAKQSKISFQSYQKAWKNFFDNMEQAEAEKYIERICDFYYHKLVMGKERLGVPTYALRSNYGTEDKELGNIDSSLLALIYILKLKQFLVEEEGGK